MHDWLEAEAAAEKAQQFFEAGQWDQALAALDLALSVNPQQSDWHYGKGMTLDAMQRYDEAAQAFEQVVKIRGELPEVMLPLGVDLVRSGQAQRGVEVLERVLELNPEAHAARCHLILAYARLDDHDKAEETFYLAQQMHDEACPQCYDHIAQSLLARGELDRAAWCWNKVRELDARYPGIHVNLGRVAWHQGRFEQAREHYVRQLREEPGDVEALLDCGRLLRAMGLPAEAGEKFRRIVELDPTVAEAHYQLGELALRSGHLDAAAGEFEMASRLDPERPGVRLSLAAVAVQRGREDEALRHLIAELEIEGQTGQQVLDIARMLIALEAPAQAIELLTPLLDGTADPLFEDEPQLANALLYRGVAMILCGDTEPGVRDLRLTLQIAPEHSVALYNLIVAYLDQGRFLRARVVLRLALRHAPGDADLQRLGLRVRREQLLDRVHRLLHWTGLARAC
jgi:tetratricopeptide (TPR) repeat protein